MQFTSQHRYLGNCQHNVYFSANKMSAGTKGCHIDLQVGYDQHSFGYRDLEGTKVNNMHLRCHAQVTIASSCMPNAHDRTG